MSLYILMLWEKCAPAALNSHSVPRSHLKIWWPLRRSPMERREVQTCCWLYPGLNCCRWGWQIQNRLTRLTWFFFFFLVHQNLWVLIKHMLGNQYCCLLLAQKDESTMMIPYLLPASSCLLSESTAGMSARASWAATDPGGCKQAKREREGGLQESEGGLGETTQRAREWHRQVAGRAESETREDRGDGEEAEGGVWSLANERNKII